MPVPMSTIYIYYISVGLYADGGCVRLSGGITAALLSSASNKICLILGLQCQIVGFILDFTRMQAVSKGSAMRKEGRKSGGQCGVWAYCCAVNKISI